MGTELNTDLNGRKQKQAQLSGLAWIENLYFRAGPDAAKGQLQRLLGADQSSRAFALCDAGQPAVGLNTVPDDEISYESFSPPAAWNATYSVQRIRLGPKSKTDFLFHTGEEILIPMQGELGFHFFWTPGSSQPERVTLTTAPGALLRINPQIPHHAWGVKGEAVAWLILRHTTNSPVALFMDPGSASVKLKHADSVKHRNGSPKSRILRRSRVTPSDLRKPGTYAMIAWGISNFIREARLKAGLTPTDLARQIGIDPSSVSRLEEAKANVSIEMLVKVCRALRIGMAECMESGSWIYERENIESKRPDADQEVSPPTGPHFLHPHILRIGKGKHRIVATSQGGGAGALSSWIVLSGRVLAELPAEMGTKSIILDAGNVLHFREDGEIAVHALQDSTLAQIVCSQTCECRTKAHASSA